jgi:hypothetical protein
MRPYWLFITLTALAVTAFAPRSVAALGPCETRDTMVAALADRYREVPVALGITKAGSLVEVLQNTRDETWTLIVTSPQGISCLVFSGEGWRDRKPPTPEPDA